MSTVEQREEAVNDDRTPVVSRSRAIMVSGVGTTLEFYDFVIYGLAAAIVFPAAFFPSQEPLVGSLIAFATFGVGFFARPLGGIVFGHLGDRIGRKPVLMATLILMGVATFIIGCLPGYSEIGVIAPILLVIVRLLQGFAAGGEWGGAALFGIESAPPGQRGFWGSFTSAGVALGSATGTAVFALVSFSAGESLADFAWRIPFWIGGLLVLVGIIARFAMPNEETPSKSKAPRVPLARAMKEHPRAVILALIVSLAYNTLAYVTIFAVGFAAQSGYGATTALIFQLVSSALSAVFAIVAARISDRWGRRRTVALGAVLLVAALAAFFPLLGTTAFIAGMFAFCFYTVALAFALGPIPAFLGEQFPRAVRFSGMSFSYQVGAALGGGTSATVASALLLAFGGDPLAVTVYMIVMALILGACALGLRETAFKTLDEINQDAGRNTAG